jgi:hypothetical protein
MPNGANLQRICADPEPDLEYVGLGDTPLTRGRQTKPHNTFLRG